MLDRTVCVDSRVGPRPHARASISTSCVSVSVRFRVPLLHVPAIILRPYRKTAMRAPGPVKQPLLICVLFALSLYLGAQYAVNLTTFNDACREDVRWASLLNYSTLAGSVVLFVFAAISVYALSSEANAESLSDISADTGVSTTSAAGSAASQ